MPAQSSSSSSTVPSDLGGILRWYCYRHAPVYLLDETSGCSPQEYPIPSPRQRRNHRVTPYGRVSPPASRSRRTCPQSCCCCSICHLERNSVMVIHTPKTCGYLAPPIVCARVLGHDGYGCPERFDDEESGMDLHSLLKRRYGEWVTVIDEDYSALGEN